MLDDFDQAAVDVSAGRIHLRHDGAGPPVLLLHGYPQTHVMWHAVAPMLADRYYVVCPDLRGYGDSVKPDADPEHAVYSKRAMGRDMVQVMAALGFETFAVAGHDRGARVAHRMALDHPSKVERMCAMDIAPTYHMLMTADRHFASAYYHWFFLTQPDGLPERMIGADPEWYLREKLKRWSAPGAEFHEEAVAEYVRCFSDPATIHASCEDYRAAAGIDLDHDRADRDANRKISCPLLVLWGARGFVGRAYDVLDVWRDYAGRVEGTSLDCGHFLPEEDPQGVTRELRRFLSEP